MGFAIRKSVKGYFELWIDYYEGGQCIESEWEYQDDLFESEDQVMTYIEENYGKVVPVGSEIYVDSNGNNPLTGVKEYFSVEELKELAHKYPNDFDFGKYIRDMIIE